MTNSWRSHPHRSPHGTTPPPTLYRNYNPGHYTAINDTQQGNAVGQDSGTVTLPGLGLVNYADSGVPGGHTRTAGPWTATSGPAVGTLNGAGAIIANTGSRGILMPYWWSELEPAKGSYLMTRLKADLAVCKFLGLQLIARIDTRSFASVNDLVPGLEQTTPPTLTDAQMYLHQFPYSVNYTGSGGGWQISRWNAFVKLRWALLIAQIYAAVGDDPNFEGIATQETSGGLTNAEQTSTGYDADDYLAALNTEVDVTLATSPTWRHFGYTNFIPGNAGENLATADARVSTYFQYMANHVGAVPGNPDILPDNSGIQNRVYPNFINTYANAHPFDGPTFSCPQPNSYAQGTRTMQQLMDFATGVGPAIGNVGHIRVDYIMWQLQTGSLAPGHHLFDPDARLCITGKPTFNTYAYPP